MRHGFRMLRALLACAAVGAALAAPAHAYVYWTNAGPANDSNGTTIGRSNLDGSGVTHSLITGASVPSAIAVDGPYLYWTNTQTNSIGRAHIDGSGADPKFIPNAVDATNGGGVIPIGITTDGTYVYWTDGERYVGRAALAGGSVTSHFINAGSSSFPDGIAVSAGTIYLGEFNAVEKVPASGGSPTLLLSLPSGNVVPTALATANGFIYIAEFDPGSSSIGRVQVNGTGLTESLIPNVNYPTGVAADGTYIYWVDHGSQQNEIGRALLTTGPSATNVQPDFASEPGGPSGVAVDAVIDATQTSLACTASALATGSPRTCTVTVADSASSSPPTGTVNLTGNGATFFSGNPCQLTVAPGGGSASCVVGAVPTTAGPQSIHAAYSGDPVHNPSAADAAICAGTATQCGASPAPPPPPPPVKCTVPKLKGKTLTQAKALLSRAHCALGKVSKPHAKKGHKLGKLVVGSQRPAPGAKLAAGTKVALVLTTPPKKRHKRR